MSIRCQNFILFFLLILLLSGCGKRLGSSREFEREFEEIQTTFESASSLPEIERAEMYRRVAIMYQGLIDKGIKSGQIYYNQGNAWYYAGERGQAIAAYKLALRYLPQNPRIIANLRVASGGNVDTDATASLTAAGITSGVITAFEYLFFWQNRIGIYQKFFYSSLLSILLFAVGLVGLFVRNKLRRFLKRLAIFLLVLTFISIVSAAYDWYRFECFSYAVISVENAQPRKGNSEQYDKAFTQPIPLGTNAVIISERGEWLNLRFGDMQDGWLPKSQVIRY
ncbi:MAG: tetratricopeptide repeat protein [Planctomycetaceae bacterium]|jgi:tetratricopeptide (TPR) repeat protein|nr:tetratricopeptide repeat protein [Planctomycetaceae bacterium]